MISTKRLFNKNLFIFFSILLLLIALLISNRIHPFRIHKAQATTQPTVEQQINILDSQITSSAGPGKGMIYIDPTVYSGTVSYYFEVDAKVSSGTGSVTLTYDSGTGSSISGGASTSATVTNTTFTRIRVPFTPSGGNAYISATSGTGITVNAARIIIVQTDPSSINDTMTQYEVGSTQTLSVTTDTPVSAPKFWTYDPTKYDGTVAVYFEATANVANATATGSATLYEAGTSCTTPNGGVTSVSVNTSGFKRLRSADISGSLTSGHTYMVCMRTSNGSVNTNIANAKIIVQQTSSTGLTKMEFTQEFTNSLQTATTASYTGQSDFNTFESGNWGGGTLTYSVRATMKSSSGSDSVNAILCYQSSSACDTTISNALTATASTNYTLASSAASFTPPDSQELDVGLKVGTGGDTISVSDFELVIDATGYPTIILPTATPTPTPAPPLIVSGNHLINANTNQILQLHGVNESSWVNACLFGNKFWDGTVPQSSGPAMWSGINAIRMHLNEDCWLGINGVPAATSGTNYQNAIAQAVANDEAAGLNVILTLGWSAPGASLSGSQNTMIDEDHGPDFWNSLAAKFGNDKAVIFELYNEPRPDGGLDNSTAASCVLNGGPAGVCATFTTAGMQEITNDVRADGAQNIILEGGPHNEGDPHLWDQYKVTDPNNDLAASWHQYPGSECHTVSCYNSDILPVANENPIIASEVGDDTSASPCNPYTYPLQVTNWIDSGGSGGTPIDNGAISFIGFVWDPFGACDNMTTDLGTGSPTDPYGLGWKSTFANAPTSFTNQTQTTNTNSSSNANSSSAPNPNFPPGYYSLIMAGPHFQSFTTNQFISGIYGAQTLIPQGSIHDDATITITWELPGDLLNEVPRVPFPWMQGINTVGEIFNYQMTAAFNGMPIKKFDRPVIVILPYDPKRLYGINPRRLRIAYYNAVLKRWQFLRSPFVLDMQHHTIATTVMSYSYFTVGYAK